MSLVIYPNGKTVEKEGLDFNGAKEIIGGGFIQDVPIHHDKYCGIICDEDGKRKGLEENHTATGLVGSHLKPFDYLVGVVILYSEGEIYK